MEFFIQEFLVRFWRLQLEGNKQMPLFTVSVPL